MAQNFSNQLSGQIGESLVVAELGRREIVATAFAGNVPDIDLLAYKNGKTLALQVKSWRSGSVSFDATRFLEITIEDKQQSVNGFVEGIDESLIFVFVKLGKALGEDKFYVLMQKDLAQIVKSNYVSFLHKHNGVRPKNYETTHCSVSEQDLNEFRDNWCIISNALI